MCPLKLIVILLAISEPIFAQEKSLTFNEAVETLALECPAAETEHLRHATALLEFENYRKSLLPSLSLNLSPISFNHSMKLIQQASDGTYYNVDDYTFNTGIGFSVSQKVGFTGGTLSASSDLSYLNEMSSSRKSFSTTPFSFSYSQPLWGGRKEFRIEKELEYKRNSISFKEYSEALADIQSHTSGLYLRALASQIALSFAERDAIISDSLLIIARRKLDNGEITQMEYRQAIIQKSNSAYSLEEARQSMKSSLRMLSDYLAIDLNEYRKITLSEPEAKIPLLLSYEDIERMALANGIFQTNQEISRIEAEKALFNARKDSFLGGSISLNYGTNQYANILSNAYSNPNARQYASLAFRIPAFQWGTLKNRRKIAENNYKANEIKIENKEREFYSTLKDMVEEFNQKSSLYVIARETYDLSREQGELFLARYSTGITSISDYHALLQEQASASENYLSALTGLWAAYFEIRKTTLYDFILQRNLVDVFETGHKGKSNNN